MDTSSCAYLFDPLNYRAAQLAAVLGGLSATVHVVLAAAGVLARPLALTLLLSLLALACAVSAQQVWRRPSMRAWWVLLGLNSAITLPRKLFLAPTQLKDLGEEALRAAPSAAESSLLLLQLTIVGIALAAGFRQMQQREEWPGLATGD